MSADWIDRAVSQIVAQLAQEPASTPEDIYVWSDGSVTGPKDNTDPEVEQLRVVAVFSPNEAPSRGAIRETLENGMRESQQSAEDEKVAIESGTRPAVLPGTVSAHNSGSAAVPAQNAVKREDSDVTTHGPDTFDRPSAPPAANPIGRARTAS